MFDLLAHLVTPYRLSSADSYRTYGISRAEVDPYHSLMKSGNAPYIPRSDLEKTLKERYRSPTATGPS